MKSFRYVGLINENCYIDDDIDEAMNNQEVEISKYSNILADQVWKDWHMK